MFRCFSFFLSFLSLFLLLFFSFLFSVVFYAGVAMLSLRGLVPRDKPKLDASSEP
jgi:hypothetical protein